MTGSHLRSVDVHGVTLELKADLQDPLEALWPRLRRFPSGARGESDFTYRFRVGPHAAIPTNPDFPSAEARPVYDAPEGGRVLYHEASDRLWMAFENRAVVACDFPAGRIDTFVARPLAENLWLASHPLFTLALLELMKRRGRFGVHAASVSRGRRGILIAGTSGAGKTTLTLTLLRAGLGFSGDDLCFLREKDGELCLLAFPDEIDVAERSLDFFPELSFLKDRERPVGRPKWPLRAEEVYDTRFVNSSRPAAVVFPEISEENESGLEAIGSDEALMELTPNVLLTHTEESRRHLQVLGRLARDAECYRLRTGRDFDRLPKMLSELLT